MSFCPRTTLPMMTCLLLGGALIATNVDATTPPVNPFLASSPYAITHFDAAQSNSFPYAVQSGTTNVAPGATPQLIAPIGVMTLGTNSPDDMWAVSLTGVSYVDVSGGGFTPLARLPAPNVANALTTLLYGVLSQPLTSVAQIEQALATLGLGNMSFGGGGVYSLVDKDNTLYTNYGNKVYAFDFVPSPLAPLLSPSITIARSLTTSFLASGESLVGLAMTFDGYLVVLGSHSVTVVPRDFSSIPQRVDFGSGEVISNSVAVDESGGIYAVSNELMHKVVWTGTQLSQDPSDGAWTAPYPTGDTYPTLFGSGSGSTPALMGFGSDPDKLVVITDGKARMDLVAFWRDPSAPGQSQMADIIPVTCGLPLSTTYIQSDQSVSIMDYGAFVVNNVSTAQQNPGVFPIDGIARGPLYASAMGVERFQWNSSTHSWSSAWADPTISDNSTVPTISRPSQMVFVNGYYPASGWEVTGLDWNTGTVRHRTVFGLNPVGNGFYSLIQFFPNGDLLFNSLLGPIRVEEPSGQVNPPL